MQRLTITEYARELNAQFSYLFAWARLIGEVDMAASLLGEFRGSQSAGWSTSITANEVRSELQAFGTKGAPLSVAELRQVLCLYSQLAEAGGVYEGLLNLMGVIQLKPYNLWPFQDLVRVKQSPKKVIGPNANAMFRKLAQVASDIGMTRLSQLLEITFRDDIRNGIFHADYIISPDGLRLRRRNGGQVIVVSYEQINVALAISLNFFQLLEGHQQDALESFRPAREIIGRFSLSPPMLHEVEFAANGGFSISTSSVARLTDAKYERQERINSLLNGSVLAAYLNARLASEREVLDEIQSAGFTPTVINFTNNSQIENVTGELYTHGLWHTSAIDNKQKNGLLLATPAGFLRVADKETFIATLPAVEELEFDEK